VTGPDVLPKGAAGVHVTFPHATGTVAVPAPAHTPSLHSAATTQVHVIQPAPAAAHQQVDVRTVEPWMFLLYRSSHYDLIYPYEQEWRQIMQSPEQT
jgi:hypothetical protein